MMESVNLAVTAAASSTVAVSAHRLSVKMRFAPSSIELCRLGRHGAVRRDDDAVDPLLRLVQLLFAKPFQLRAPLVGLDRAIELDLAAFETAHDAFQLGQRVLETHCSNIVRQ